MYYAYKDADDMPEEVAQLFFDPNDEWEEDLSLSLTSSLSSRRNSRPATLGDSTTLEGLDAMLADTETNGSNARDRLEGRDFNDGVTLRPRNTGDAKVRFVAGLLLLQ